MILPDRLQRAFDALGTALDSLDAAAARRAEMDTARADIDQEFAVMQDDRSRLALDLDAALAQSRMLDRAAEEVATRLARAGSTVREILAQISRVEPTPSDPA